MESLKTNKLTINTPNQTNVYFKETIKKKNMYTKEKVYQVILREIMHELKLQIHILYYTI